MKLRSMLFGVLALSFFTESSVLAAQSRIGCELIGTQRTVWIRFAALPESEMSFMGVGEFQIYKPLGRVVENSVTNAQLMVQLATDSSGRRQVSQVSAALGRSGQFAAQVQDLESGNGTYKNAVFGSHVPAEGELTCWFDARVNPRSL